MQRLADELGVPWQHERPVRDPGGVLEHVGRVAAVQQRIEEHAVADAADAAHGLGSRVALASDHVQVQRDGEARVGRHDLPERGDREAVREVEVVHRPERVLGVRAAGRVHPGRVDEVRRAPRLVERGPGADAVAERLAHDPRVVGERVRGVAARPAALVLERLREVPVVERRDGRDPPRHEPVDQPPVERQALRVRRPAPGRLDARPRDREAVRLQAEGLHQVEVGVEPVVVVVGDVARVPAEDLPGRAAERVPDGGAAPALVDRALDLIRGGGGSEQEPGRELEALAPIVGGIHVRSGCGGRCVGHVGWTSPSGRWRAGGCACARSTTTSCHPAGVPTARPADPPAPCRRCAATSLRLGCS